LYSKNDYAISETPGRSCQAGRKLSAITIYTAQQGFELAKASMVATRTHLDLAADFLVHVFDSNHVSYAFMGGYSLALRGSLRETYDIDLTIGCDMDKLVQIIKAQNGDV
jgi:hypothetical protein